MKYQAILGMPPFGVPQSEKERLLLPYLSLLTEKHRECCPEYGRVLKILGYSREKAGKIEKLEQIPMIPVSLFKGGGLKSVPALEIFKTVQSSGTTGQKRSEIVLDRNTAADQQKTLSAVAGDFIGRGRFPLLIVDSPEVLKNRELFSARGAGILGFSIFGTERFYALNSDMSLNLDGIQEFLERHRGEPVLLFGFTFMIWKYFY
ncbi:MAG: acyl-protein synthetase, partial [[Clostridium] symbiosum]